MRRPSRRDFAFIALAAALACEPDGLHIQPGASPASGALALTEDDRLLVIASEDHDQLLVVDRESRELVHRVDVSDTPYHVIVDGDRAVVSARYAHSLDVVDVARGEVIHSITVGVEPLGLTRVSDDEVAVALGGEAAVAIVDVEAGRVVKKIELPTADPRAVARLKGGKLYVSHVTAGVLSEVDVEHETARTLDLATRNDFGPRVHPNLVRSLTVSPEGDRLLTAHSQANSDTVRAPIGEGFDDPSAGGQCGYSGCATELPAVTPSVTEVDVETGTVIVPQPASSEGGGDVAEPMPDCADCFFGTGTPNPPSILNPNEPRFGGIPMNNPVALALFDGGRGQLVLNLGSRNVVMLRRELRGTADDVIGVVQVGHGASAIAVTHDGRFAYVWNQFDGTLTEIELPRLDQEVRTRSKLVPTHSDAEAPAEFREVVEFAAETFPLVEDALDPVVSRGRKLFHDALDARISRSRSVSCASCHPDGRSDGQTWKFTFGPRNTPQLGGGILDTAPFHWPGDVTTIRDLNTMTVLAFMGGSGLDAESMDAIGAFIDTIPAAPSKVALEPELTEAQARGKAIFEDPVVGCTACHAGPHFTDNQSWDVGTQAGSHDITHFQTPVLHGLNRSAPYMHTGEARTLRELVDILVRTDKMGTGSHLTEDQLDDLVEYLKTL